MNALSLQGLRKAFGPCVANEDVSFDVREGSVHAIVGENGAGKSTAMKMVSGLWRPDGGRIFVCGREVRFSSPEDAVASGIGMVHQHFMLAGTHTVLENILLGTEKNPALARDRRAARRKVERIKESYGLEVPLDAFVEDLPVGVQQRVEILKVLYRDSRILILDEPTAVLTPPETESLFANLKSLQKEGKTILLITHKLREVMAVAERITVLRRGRVVGTVARDATSIEQLAEMMVGRRVTMPVGGEASPGAPVLEVKELSVAAPGGAEAVCGISLTVRGGEIVGVAGVEGNGQSELIRGILFPDERKRGEVAFFGISTSGSTPAEIRRLGVGVLAEDRIEQSLVASLTLEENLLLGPPWRERHSVHGLIRFSGLREEGGRLLGDWDVRPGNLSAPAESLSGGNQQKFVVGRELTGDPKFLLAAQPTRGVDVGAVEFVHRKLLEARDRGAAVLLFSSDLDEILRLSDRILVMYEGRMAAEFRRGEADEKKLGIPMGGGRP